MENKDKELENKDKELANKDKELEQKDQALINSYRLLKQSGIPISTIQEITKFSKEEIEKL